MNLLLDPSIAAEELARTFGLEHLRVAPETPLFSSGLLGYLEMAETLDWLEKRTGITVEASDVRLECIDTPRSMCELVARKLGAGVIEMKPVAKVSDRSAAKVS